MKWSNNENFKYYIECIKCMDVGFFLQIINI